MKKKCYEEGGEVDTDDTTSGMKEAYDSRDDSEPEPRMGSGMKEKVAPAGTFKQAFAAARKSGQKVFTFNGKKYNTNLASEKSPAKPKPTATSEAMGRANPMGDIAFKKGGSVCPASRRADGIAQRGKTKCKMV